MELHIEANIVKDSDAWHAEYNAKRNAAVAALVKDGADGNLWKRQGDLSRDERDDEQMRWLFWRQQKPDAERSRHDREMPADVYLYEGVTQCMKAARDDEQKRIAKAIGAGLKALLGDEFNSILYDIAREHDINIGYDW